MVAEYAVSLPATFYAFDFIAFGDYDARPLPLYERKRMLEMLLPSGGTIRLSEHVAERGMDFFAAAEAKCAVRKNAFSIEHVLQQFFNAPFPRCVANFCFCVVQVLHQTNYFFHLIFKNADHINIIR